MKLNISLRLVNLERRAALKKPSILTGIEHTELIADSGLFGVTGSSSDGKSI